MASTQNKGIIKGLNHIKRFTPSAIGNVEKAASSGMFEVLNGVIINYTGNVLKENLSNYFERNKNKVVKEKTLPSLPENAQKVTGVGSNAWFVIEEENSLEKTYKITRYNDLHELDYAGFFETEGEFDITVDFQFTHNSHCHHCHILQEGQKIKFLKIKTCPKFIELQKVLSA